MAKVLQIDDPISYEQARGKKKWEQPTKEEYGDDINDQKSVGSYDFHIGSSPITWSSKKKITTSLSSCGAEYRVAKDLGKEAIWIQKVNIKGGWCYNVPLSFVSFL